MGDMANHVARSDDGGRSWTPAQPTDIQGQTMSTLPLDRHRLLVAYNRRHTDPGIVLAVARLDDGWHTFQEQTLYRAAAPSETTAPPLDGVVAMNRFQFGFPTAIRVEADTALITYWSVLDGRCGVRFARIRIPRL